MTFNHEAVLAADHVQEVCTAKLLEPPLTGKVDDAGFRVMAHCDAPSLTVMVVDEPVA